MIEVGGNLYIIGGWSPDGSSYQKEIQKLLCVSGTCSWITLTKQLNVGRGFAIAIPVIDSFCTLNWVNKSTLIFLRKFRISESFSNWFFWTDQKMVLEMFLNYWLSWLQYWKMPMVRNHWIKHFFWECHTILSKFPEISLKIHNRRIPKEDSNYVPLLSSNALTLWSLISRAQLLLKKERHRGRQRLRNSTRGGGGAAHCAAAATRRTRRARTITCFSSKPTIAEVAGLKAVVPFTRGLLHFIVWDLY